jgi:SAM-dependent methyltransferase
VITTWSQGSADEGMPEALLVETLDKVRRHPWWRARAKLALAALQAQDIIPPASVFDVGCGWGVNLQSLENAGYHATGLDISRRILEIIDRPDRQLVEADITQPLPASFANCDGLLALDVIEHLDDDQHAVRQLARLVGSGGIVIVSVPALPDLFSEYDRIQGHRRRYLPETLRAAFANTGLMLQNLFWWGAWMVPILRRMRQNTSGNRAPARTYADYLRIPPWPVPWLMNLLYEWEHRRALRGRLRTGTSLFAVAARED